ncbi:methionyl-tRNA formyltransferase [Paucibacter sp. KCTC 42545]|uniref:methionyl-tRNA formyltransferase n=1 Tax=Paucibacter sp. KCTC 42545 TaxID=1768242 RepID=UPI000733B08A|nr:methionyl-tRNA formyltransferase [Paucibacter sp. KCTC 42545]ALT79503.1 methionyl-tRNA formyltransferase [Paucibacter sp. KCTC 42545]
MRVVFAGTPEFAASALQALLTAGFEVTLVLTQPDRPAGRGMKLQASAVKQVALQHGIAVAQPRSLRLDGKFPEEAAAAREALLAAKADVMVVAAYGLILPQWVLDLPARGCLNIHASLLPRWRGAAPIHRAIEAGDAQTGITIMQMDAGLDTGDMLSIERLDIAPADTTASLHDRLAVLGGRMIVEALELAAAGGLRPVPQPAEGVTYAHKIEKAEAQLDWRQNAALLERRLRAFDPFPGGLAHLDGEAIKVWRAEVAEGSGPQGQVLRVDETGITVACGQQALRLTELQRAGGKRLPAAAFLQAKPIAVGAVFAAVEMPAAAAT